jgi:hypothetical protein
MSNHKIIAQEASKRGYNYNGLNLDTYYNWVKRGYQVKLGQKAFIKTRLWSQGINKRKILVSLFNIEQVLEIKNKELVALL